MDLVRSNALASSMRHRLSTNTPDALAILKSFEKNRWLKELASRGLEESHYGLRIIKDAAKDEMVKRDQPSSPDGNHTLQAAFDLKIDGLD